MATVAIRIELPPKGALETSGDGTNPTDDQTNEELQIRQEYIDRVAPVLGALLERPARRSGNATEVQLLGTDVWSQMNHYLLLVTVDIGDPGIDLSALVPGGGEATVIGSYANLRQWPADSTDVAFHTIAAHKV
ncbi:MAG: hypothetical protein QOE07_695 [Acidimicrobiaceae bacterium]|nr:hypothetical protein [Acidimicrobiaceae bacterium]